MNVRLRIAGVHAKALHAHLFPGDGKEAVAIALCGRHQAGDHDVLLVHELHPIPYDQCPVREADRVTWRTESLESVLASAAERGLGVVKFHSHPTGYESFSRTDDDSDRDLFPSICGWVDDDGPHASVVVLPDGRMFGRSVDVNNRFGMLDRISVVGDHIAIAPVPDDDALPEHAERHKQLFGEFTTRLLRNLSIGVVGCSGTGSWVVEMLARLGVRRLVLVDPDVVEKRNLNRIVGTKVSDIGRPKPSALADSVTSIGLGTQVEAIPTMLATRRAVSALATCDVVFGCVDSHEARRTLNRLSAFYLLPYFDCGVSLVADGRGGIDEVCAAAHYFRPDGSTALARGVIRQKRADAEVMARTDPARYKDLLAEGYIDGVVVDSPAVISVNGLAASLVVNELLARLHPYRDEADTNCASVRFVYSQMRLDVEADSGDGWPIRMVGRGDVEPLLDMPVLAHGNRAA